MPIFRLCSFSDRLQGVESKLRQEVKTVKHDRAEVVSKVVPYIAMELAKSDEMAKYVGRLTSFVVFCGRCATLEDVSNMKEPLNLAKVKGYRPTYKKDILRLEMTLPLLYSYSHLKPQQILQLPNVLSCSIPDQMEFREFDIEIKNKKGAENVTANHLSRLENLNMEELKDAEIDDNFPDETLMNVSSNDEEKD
ncbi:hypothetical protein Tco_0578441 [Tanacetum coccineum]